MTNSLSLPSADATVDARGLNCPLPILKAKKALAAMTDGQVLLVLTTDRSAISDFKAFTRQTGHLLLEQKDAEPTSEHWIQKAARP